MSQLKGNFSQNCGGMGFAKLRFRRFLAYILLSGAVLEPSVPPSFFLRDRMCLPRQPRFRIVFCGSASVHAVQGIPPPYVGGYNG
jgi:hypothetical protein